MVRREPHGRRLPLAPRWARRRRLLLHGGRRGPAPRAPGRGRAAAERDGEGRGREGRGRQVAAPGPRRWDRASAAPARPRREIPPPRPGGGGPRGAAPTPRSVKAASAPRSRDSAVPPAGSGMGWGGGDAITWDGTVDTLPLYPPSPPHPCPSSTPRTRDRNPWQGSSTPRIPTQWGTLRAGRMSTAQHSTAQPRELNAAAPARGGCTPETWVHHTIPAALGGHPGSSPPGGSWVQEPTTDVPVGLCWPRGQRSPRSSTHSLQCRAHCCFLNVKLHFAYNN